MNAINERTEIYVDMDGVLVDFFGTWAKIQGVSHYKEIQDPDNVILNLRHVEGFWLDLPMTNNAIALLELVREVKGQYRILSNPLPNDPNCQAHKTEWIKRHLSFFTPDAVHFTGDKAQFAIQPDGTPNILIDDYGVNIRKWEAAGGIGFKHKDHKFERTVRNIDLHLR